MDQGKHPPKHPNHPEWTGTQGSNSLQVSGRHGKYERRPRGANDSPKSKIHIATQKIFAEKVNEEFKGMKMTAIWEIVGTIKIPIITYGSESWEHPHTLTPHPIPPHPQHTHTIYIYIYMIKNDPNWNNIQKDIASTLELPDQTPTAIVLAEKRFLTIEMIENKEKITHTEC